MCLVSVKEMSKQVKSRSALASYVTLSGDGQKRSDLRDPYVRGCPACSPACPPAQKERVSFASRTTSCRAVLQVISDLEEFFFFFFFFFLLYCKHWIVLEFPVWDGL